MENFKWCVNWMTTNHGGNGTHYSLAETLEEAIEECKQEYMYDHYTGLVIRPDLKITDVWQFVQYGDGEFRKQPCREKSIEDLWEAACSGDIDTLKAYYKNGGEKNRRFEKFGKKHSLVAGAIRNGESETVKYLLSVGETTESHEAMELDSFMKAENFTNAKLKEIKENAFKEFVKLLEDRAEETIEYSEHYFTISESDLNNLFLDLR